MRLCCAPPRRWQRGAGAGGLAAAPQSARQSLRGRARRGAARRGSARVWQEGGRGCVGGRRAREGGRRRGSAPGAPAGDERGVRARGTDFFARGPPSGPGCCAQASAHARRARTAGETHLRHGVAWDDRGGARDRRPRGARAVAAAPGAATRARHRRAETPSSAWPR